MRKPFHVKIIHFKAMHTKAHLSGMISKDIDIAPKNCIKTRVLVHKRTLRLDSFFCFELIGAFPSLLIGNVCKPSKLHSNE